MLREENELLTQVGPGTAMGAVFRSFWLPALLAEELPEPHCPPVKVRLLGEDLIAFRDTNGEIGLLDQYCAHRGANLFWGRNEECGLRCVYHGWKYDIHGNCVDIPNEPAGSTRKDRIRLLAYPAREAGGVIWGYLGSEAEPPPLPALEWTLVPASHRYVHKRLQDCNYLQNLEGEVDSSHVSFLHRNLRPESSSLGRMDGYVPGQQLMSRTTDSSPVFDLQETAYGLVIGARRNFDDAHHYWRLTQFLMPSYTMIPSEPGQPISFTAAVPIDDTHTCGYTVSWHPDRPLEQAEISGIESWTGIYAEVEKPGYRPVLNKANDYRIDRVLQRTRSYTGIRGVREQDLAVQEDQRGPITDRTREHLGDSDTAVVATRQKLLAAMRSIEAGKLPEAALQPSAYRVRSAAVLAPRAGGLAQVLAGPARVAAGIL